MAIPADRMRAWRSFLEAQRRVLPLLESELQSQTGLPLTWYDVLVQLNEREGGRLRMQDLAHAVLLSKSGLSRLIDRMEEDCLVERTPCIDDGRGYWIVLTDKGRSRLAQAAPIHMRGVSEHFTRWLDGEEPKLMAAVLERIALAAQAATLP